MFSYPISNSSVTGVSHRTQIGSVILDSVVTVCCSLNVIEGVVPFV